MVSGFHEYYVVNVLEKGPKKGSRVEKKFSDYQK